MQTYYFVVFIVILFFHNLTSFFYLNLKLDMQMSNLEAVLWINTQVLWLSMNSKVEYKYSDVDLLVCDIGSIRHTSPW